jgi:hypothetical protein
LITLFFLSGSEMPRAVRASLVRHQQLQPEVHGGHDRRFRALPEDGGTEATGDELIEVFFRHQRWDKHSSLFAPGARQTL